MASWVKNRVELLRKNEESRNREREWQLHRAEVLPAKAQRLWENLGNTIERDVREFNAEFLADATRQFEIVRHSLEIIVRRTYYPEFRLFVHLDLTNECVTHEKCKTQNPQCDDQPDFLVQVE
jgi:hypothetical protein